MLLSHGLPHRGRTHGDVQWSLAGSVLLGCPVAPPGASSEPWAHRPDPSKGDVVGETVGLAVLLCLRKLQHSSLGRLQAAFQLLPARPLHSREVTGAGRLGIPAPLALLHHTSSPPWPSTERSSLRLTRAALGGKGTGTRRAKMRARLPFSAPLRWERGAGVPERAAGIRRLVVWQHVLPSGQQV